jgi:hypothetical protein
MTRQTGRSYHAYLIRCWREESARDEEHPWRFSVEVVLRERQRKAFVSLESLFAFLQAELACDPNKPSDES